MNNSTHADQLCTISPSVPPADHRISVPAPSSDQSNMPQPPTRSTKGTEKETDESKVGGRLLDLSRDGSEDETSNPTEKDTGNVPPASTEKEAGAILPVPPRKTAVQSLQLPPRRTQVQSSQCSPRKRSGRPHRSLAIQIRRPPQSSTALPCPAGKASVPTTVTVKKNNRLDDFWNGSAVTQAARERWTTRQRCWHNMRETWRAKPYLSSNKQ